MSPAPAISADPVPELENDHGAKVVSIGSPSEKSARYIKMWQENVRGGFATFPVVLERASGHIITDVDGKEYIDMISQFAVINFGYTHPRITEAVVKQIRKVATFNTSYVHPLYAEFASRICKKFGYSGVATMITGSEGVESAVKIARKWAYVKKGIPTDEAWVITADSCYHGLTLATMPLSNHMASNFGKHLPNVGPVGPSSGRLIRFGNADDLEIVLREDANKIAAFMIEPIQGYSGTVVPPKGYLKAVQDLCSRYNILFICDEVQTGYGRTGTDLAFQNEPGVKPDLVVLGKAITGGQLPMSAILGNESTLGLLKPYEVASTYAAAPVACAAAIAALDVLEEEKISERSQKLGSILTEAFEKAVLPHLLDHRGKRRGLFQTLVVDEDASSGITARRIAALCAHRGVLVGNAANRLRFSPPLTICREDMLKAVDVVVSAFRDVSKLGDFLGSDGL
ncbi:unnamed protein product [Clonostachys rosea]|uniref:Ornithine aminotransferase n=1 Tax=Bionectria ochroleuca TaxID=29856 RepID=A0ABY6UL93_BIOOC|nr:unnamed protein product [Clonostachys rosea]